MKAVYRIVCAALAIAALPIMYFQPLLRLIFSPNQILIEEKISMKRAVDLFTGDGIFSNLTGGKGLTMTPALKELLTPVIATGVLLAIAVIIMIIIFFFAVFSNKQLLITILSAVGLILVAVSFITFKSATNPIINGEVPLSSLIEMGFLGSMISSLISIKVLQLSSAPTLLLFLFIFILAWSLSFVITDIGEEAPQKSNTKKLKI